MDRKRQSRAAVAKLRSIPNFPQNINRTAGDSRGFSWETLRYGDVFQVVRGDSLLDICIRNGSSEILKNAVRELGGVAKQLEKLSAWECECAFRRDELNSTEGTLCIVPPLQVSAFLLEKTRAVDQASKAAAKDALSAALQIPSRVKLAATVGEAIAAEARKEKTAVTSTPTSPGWQKRHFCFIPDENSLEGFCPLVAIGDKPPEFRFSPEHATRIEIKSNGSKTTNDKSFFIAAPDGWFPFEVVLCGGGGPVCFAAPSEDERRAWQKAINSKAGATQAEKPAFSVNERLSELRWRLVKGSVLRPTTTRKGLMRNQP